MSALGAAMMPVSREKATGSIGRSSALQLGGDSIREAVG
jgi:hypothetical protein